jgi:O-acetyl-ADP-ribose deacetylase (regulator of RNase III)
MDASAKAQTRSARRVSRLPAMELLQVHHDNRSALQVCCAGKPAAVAADQIRTISKTRIGATIGTLSPAEAAALRRPRTDMYGESLPGLSQDTVGQECTDSRRARRTYHDVARVACNAKTKQP